nr:glycine cleavage system protein H [Saprospiraceae bacterium]
PLGGEVIEFNDELNEDEGDNPSLINDDPYGTGWIVKIKVSEESEIEDLLSAEEYGKLIS